MKIIRRNFLVGGAALLASSVGFSRRQARAATGKPQVLVELYTSQGCSSCPPAEAYLKDLAKRSDVIALEFHVDYWDYIGWKDPFADPSYTQRQRRYNRLFGSPYNYTPQMVIDGRAHEVGSRRSAVDARIEAARMKREMAMRDGPVPTLSAQQNGDGSMTVSLTGTPFEPGSYDILAASFDKSHATDVRRGENSGRELVNTNVVRKLSTVLKGWNGGDVVAQIPAKLLPGDGGCAVIVQDQRSGYIAQCTSMPLMSS